MFNKGTAKKQAVKIPALIESMLLDGGGGCLVELDS